MSKRLDGKGMEQLHQGLAANDAHRWGTEFLDQLGTSRRAA